MQEQRPSLLALLVSQDERTQGEIIAGYNDCAREHEEDAALSPRTFRRWLTADVQTQPRPAQRRVARFYWGFAMAQLLEPAPPEMLNPKTVAETRSATLVQPIVRPLGHGFEAESLSVSPSIERQISMATRRAARFTAFAEARNIGGETVAQLRDQVSELARACIRDPLHVIIGDLIETQDTVFTLLEGKQKPTQTRDLYVLAGIVSGLLAKTSHDLGHSHDAMTQARTVYVCADNADNNGLRAFARSMQSLIAYWAGRPQEAVRYAIAGSEVAGNVTGSTTAWLPSLEARAWAQLSDADKAHDAIGRARDARERITPDDLDTMGGILTFPLAKQRYYAAGALVYLDGEAAEGGGEATAALELYEQGDIADRSYGDEAGARAELAVARIQEGDLDGAYEAVGPVFDLPPERRNNGIVASAMRVHLALRDPRFTGSAVARNARGEIEDFCQRPVAALPR
jgi:tetratricopeptide (TPR) repeat protein